jgi:hypothetical protein
MRTVSIGERKREGGVHGSRWLAGGVVEVLLGGSTSPIGGREGRE